MIQMNANTRLDYLHTRVMLFLHCTYACLTCFHNDFIFIFLITQIYQILWSSEVIHQEHWKADLCWILLSDLIWQVHIGIPKIRPSLHPSSSLCEGNQTPEPGNPLKDIRKQYVNTCPESYCCRYILKS